MCIPFQTQYLYRERSRKQERDRKNFLKKREKKIACKSMRIIEKCNENKEKEIYKKSYQKPVEAFLKTHNELFINFS